MDINYYIRRVDKDFSNEKEHYVEITDPIYIEELSKLKMDYITIKSPNKLWKIQVDDNGELTTSEII